mgnify:FL=1
MNIKVVDESKPDVFEEKVNELLKMGYKISSTSCGFVNSEAYDFCSVYQAILIKE